MNTRERIAQLKALSKTYAKAKADYEYLDHFRKSKLAILKREFSNKNPEWSNVKCDDAARCHQEYLDVLSGIREACEISEAARWELEIARAGISIYQTQRADRRAELNNLGDS